MKKQKPHVKHIAKVIEHCQKIYLKGLLEQNKQKLEQLAKIEKIKNKAKKNERKRNNEIRNRSV